MSELEDTVEYLVGGFSFDGTAYPVVQMRGTLCAQCAVNYYVETYPHAIHIKMSIVLPIKTEGRA